MFANVTPEHLLIKRENHVLLTYSNDLRRSGRFCEIPVFPAAPFSVHNLSLSLSFPGLRRPEPHVKHYQCSLFTGTLLGNSASLSLLWLLHFPTTHYRDNFLLTLSFSHARAQRPRSGPRLAAAAVAGLIASASSDLWSSSGLSGMFPGCCVNCKH